MPDDQDGPESCCCCRRRRLLVESGEQGESCQRSLWIHFQILDSFQSWPAKPISRRCQEFSSGSCWTGAEQ